MVTSKSENGVMVPKPKQEWDELDKKKVQLNTKVVYILHCAIDEMNLIMFGNVSRLKKFRDY